MTYDELLDRHRRLVAAARAVKDDAGAWAATSTEVWDAFIAALADEPETVSRP